MILPFLDKCILFQLCFTLSSTSFQIDFNLNKAPKGRPKYLKCKWDISHPKTESNAFHIGNTSYQDYFWFNQVCIYTWSGSET